MYLIWQYFSKFFHLQDVEKVDAVQGKTAKGVQKNQGKPEHSGKR